MERFIMAQKGSPVNVIVGIAKNIKSYKRSIVCIKENEVVYKIVSLSATKDGSINIFFPYCSEKKSSVIQYKYKYDGTRFIKDEDVIKNFIVDSTTKMSIHKSGFVQLSGNGILSGIDNQTGTPKGVGLFSSPLDTPVQSGPTFIFQCWLLNKGFAVLEKKDKNAQYVILDKQQDFIEKKIPGRRRLNSYALEFFIFPKQSNEFVYYYNNNPFIDHIITNHTIFPPKRFCHPVIDIKNFDGVICVFPNLVNIEISPAGKSGFMMNSPGGSMNILDKNKAGCNFCIKCPREDKYSKKNFINLDFKKI